MSVASVGSNLYAFSQSISVNGSSSSTADSSAAQPSTANQSASTGVAAAPSGHHHHGHHKGVSSQLESAIESALQSSSSTTDPNQVIQDAIAKMLTGSADTSASGTTAIDGSTTASSATSAADSQAAFGQVLQSYGVNPQQFQQDLQSAIQNSRQNGGTVDYAALFQNFPPGSIINTTA